jgi:hypothetical protein
LPAESWFDAAQQRVVVVAAVGDRRGMDRRFDDELQRVAGSGPLVGALGPGQEIGLRGT